jgi:putative toxin-antitoxin system antitoxin component (TIGR02293 family)
MAKKNQEVNEHAIAAYNTTRVSVRSILDLALGWMDEPLSRVDTFRNGIGKNAFENLKELSGLDYGTLADVLGVSTKTLQRKTVFDTIQSEKIYELADLYATGVNYFGRDGFRRWMDRPLFSIGNRKPLELIDVSAGIDLLKIEIMRLQHGIAV